MELVKRETQISQGPVLVIATNQPRFFVHHRIGLVREARAKGYRVIGMFPDGPEVEHIKSLGFEVEIIHMTRKGVNPLSELKSIWSIYKSLKRLNPEIYQAFTIKPVIYGAIAARLVGVQKVICTITGLGYSFIANSIRGKLTRRIVKSLYHMAFAGDQVKVIFQNQDDHKFFIDEGFVSKEQTKVILGTGVDITKFDRTLKFKTPKVYILFPSRMLLHKGIVELVEACKLLHAKGIDFQLTLCGEPDKGNPASITEDQLSQWGKLDFIQLVGQQSDMVSMYRNADIVCLPSYREGLPLSLLEAAACGLPIVSTDAPGCRDVVEEGANGFLVPVASTVELSKALEKLIQSSELRTKFGLVSRMMAESDFDQTLVLQSYLELYRDSKTEVKAA